MGLRARKRRKNDIKEKMWGQWDLNPRRHGFVVNHYSSAMCSPSLNYGPLDKPNLRVNL